MITTCLMICILCLTVYCIYGMLSKLRQAPKTSFNLSTKLKLALTGIISFISDTIGIGSFAVVIALSRYFKTFRDEELPALTNGAQVIPGTLESIFFMQIIQVDPITLITLVLGTSLGGILGGHVITKLNQQKIRLTMMIAFIAVISLLLSEKLGLISQSGNLLALTGNKLIFGFFALMICGALTSVGIGLFGMVQAILFLLGVSPAVAFPIMTTAGAMQQPLTTLVFLKQNKIPLKKTLFISAFGCLGVLISLPIVRHLNTHWLHNLLLCVMFYNVVTIALTYWRKKQTITEILQPGPT